MDPVHRQLLDQFLVDNDDLASLNDRLSRLNIFRVLRIENAEIRHSNVLGWLLDPLAPHGLGDLFLRRFLSRLLLANPDVPPPFSAAEVELMDLEGVTVRREWRSIDILVENESPPWCLVLENKIHSGEGVGQLARYRATVESEMPGVPLLPVFLTLQGDEPSTGGKAASYLGVSYREILDLVSRLIAQRRTQIPAGALLLLEHWQESLRRLTLTDHELVDLCRRIYRRHREAIDLIVKYGVASGVVAACTDFVKGMQDLAFEPVAQGQFVWFVPRQMAEIQRPSTPGWSHLPKSYPISWWFQNLPNEKKLQLGLEVGPFDDPDMRIALLTACKEAGFELSREAKAFRREAQFTRLWTKTEKLKTDSDGNVLEDPAAVLDAAQRLWRAATAETPRLVKALTGFAWSTT